MLAVATARAKSAVERMQLLEAELDRERSYVSQASRRIAEQAAALEATKSVVEQARQQAASHARDRQTIVQHHRLTEQHHHALGAHAAYDGH